MKKLYKYLSPFAPDQSGACGVLYELGGIIVICDAGGCTGNICGFDEPRWSTKRSAVFSAGLRDMDAIMGRDDKLIEKLSSAQQLIGARFAAIIGTPVPAVIATDMTALKRLTEKKLGIPCITVECSGTHYYDIGEERAWLALFSEFAKEKYPTVTGKTGIIGATPLETGCIDSGYLQKLATEHGVTDPVIFGCGSALDDIIKASACENIIAVSVSAIKSAEYLHERFGIPYTVRYPFLSDDIIAAVKSCKGKALVIDSQIKANEIRKCSSVPENITCASWFMMNEGHTCPQDTHIKGEDDLRNIVADGNYDNILADADMERIVKAAGFTGRFIDIPHFAVSGRLKK